MRLQNAFSTSRISTVRYVPHVGGGGVDWVSVDIGETWSLNLTSCVRDSSCLQRYEPTTNNTNYVAIYQDGF